MEDKTILLSSTYFGPVQWYQKLNRHRCVIEQHDNFVKQTYRNRCVIASANGPQTLTVPTERYDGLKCPMRDIRISDHGNWRHLHWQALVSAYGETPFFEYYADDLRPYFEERRWTYLLDFNLDIMHTLCSLLDVRPTLSLSDHYITTDAPTAVHAATTAVHAATTTAHAAATATTGGSDSMGEEAELNAESKLFEEAKGAGSNAESKLFEEAKGAGSNAESKLFEEAKGAGSNAESKLFEEAKGAGIMGGEAGIMGGEAGCNFIDLRDAIRPKRPLPDSEFDPRPYYQVRAARHGFLPNLSVLDLLFNEGPEGIFWL